KLFPQAGFFLMIDAEWYVNNVQLLLEFCKIMLHSNVESFLLKICSGGVEFYAQRLFKPNCGILFLGVVHENINQISSVKVPFPFFIKYLPKNTGIEKTKKRWL